MKHTSKVALCGMISAIAVMLMLLSYFPYFTYAIPAVSGLIFVILVIEINPKWAFLAYFASSVLVALLAEPEAKIMFIAFFGYYPILKGIIERIRKTVIEILIKFSLFNIIIISVAFLLIYVFRVPIEAMGNFGKYSAWILLIMGNVTFLIYDFCITQMITAYMDTLHPRLKKIIRKK